MKLLEQANDIINELWIEIVSLQQMNDIQNVSLPVQRELIDLKIEKSQLMTDFLEMNLNEVKAKNAKSLRQDNITKVFDFTN